MLNINLNKKQVTRTITTLLAVGVVSTMVIAGCTVNNPAGEGRESREHTEQQGEHGTAGESGGESDGEHGTAGESGSESSGESSGEHGATGSEDAANALRLDETYDEVQYGARLVMRYDAQANAFVGTVENTTDTTLDQVRVEIHLSNGTELGPTPRTDLAAGETMDITLPATAEAFDGWIAHAEVGSNEAGHGADSGGEGNGEGTDEHGADDESGGEGAESGGEGAGEHGGAGGEGHGNEGGAEGGEGSGESGDPSSPILALNESWDGVVNGIRTAMSYDEATGSFSGLVENTTDQTICFVQIELNLKQGTQTVVELGPQPVGDLAPGQQVTTELLVANEPEAVGVTFDAWEIHPEMFDCNGPGPAAGDDAGIEGHGSESGSEGSGEHGSGG